jgi:hypothetical protein
MYACMYVHIHTHEVTNVCVYVCTHMHTYEVTNVCVYVCTHIHTHQVCTTLEQ